MKGVSELRRKFAVKSSSMREWNEWVSQRESGEDNKGAMMMRTGQGSHDEFTFICFEILQSPTVS